MCEITFKSYLFKSAILNRYILVLYSLWRTMPKKCFLYVIKDEVSPQNKNWIIPLPSGFDVLNISRIHHGVIYIPAKYISITLSIKCLSISQQLFCPHMATFSSDKQSYWRCNIGWEFEYSSTKRQGVVSTVLSHWHSGTRICKARARCGQTASEDNTSRPIGNYLLVIWCQKRESKELLKY